jgi:outer membrane protein
MNTPQSYLIVLLAGLISMVAPASAQTTTADTPTVRLTIADAEARALGRNPTLAQARLSTELADYSIVQSRTAFTPTFSTSFEQRSQTAAGTSQLTGGAQVVTDNTSYQSGVAQLLPWGGRVSVDFTSGRNASNNVFSTFNPRFSSSIAAAVTQPLLRGFAIDATRGQIEQAEIGREVAGVRLTRQEATTLAAVRRAYWELVYASDALENARRSEALAERQLDEDRLRVEIGALAEIDTLQSEAEVATRLQASVQAEGAWRTTMVTLKQLIVADTQDPIWEAEVVPVDRPAPGAQPIDVGTAIRSALSNRTDIQEAQHDRDSIDLSLELAQSERLWGVDLVAGYTATGIGGPQLVRGSNLGGTVVETVPGGYLDALTSVAGLDFPTWSVGLNVSVPLGTSRADADVASARVQQRQVDSRIQTLELQVAADITRAGERVRSAAQQVQAAAVARELSARRLEAEDARLDVGLSTTFLVLQAQRDLAAAETSELRAALDHRVALVDFELAQVAP